MSRQRIKTGIREINYSACSQCNGLGVIRTPEAAALAILRKIRTKAVKGDLMTIKGILSPEVALYLLNQKREELSSLEDDYHLRIHLSGDARVSAHEARLEFIKKPIRDPELDLISNKREETPEEFTAAIASQFSMESHSLSSPSDKEQEGTVAEEDTSKAEARGSLARFWFWRPKK
jgi:ribonuclease E